MEIDSRKIWQQGSGDGDRSYYNICLKWDVILNGPGYAGHIEKSAATLKEDGWSTKKISDLRRFAFDLKPGDIVVLRSGTHLVYGVGCIVGDYSWNSIFSDIDGWDLQHVRRVVWLWKYTTDNFGKPYEFPIYTLKQGDTTQPLSSSVVLGWIKTLKLNFMQLESVINLPVETPGEISISNISDYLFGKGTASASIESLVNTIGDLQMIARWYKKETNPSEFETEAYLVIPLLRSLGWTPQKMALEWNNVDISLFSRLPRKDDHLVAVVEAKRKGTSCLKAFSQASTYAKPLKNCDRLVVSDGLRYGVFTKVENTESDYKLYAYLNLTELKSDYPVLECKGILEALWAMTPEWSM